MLYLSIDKLSARHASFTAIFDSLAPLALGVQPHIGQDSEISPVLFNFRLNCHCFPPDSAGTKALSSFSSVFRKHATLVLHGRSARHSAPPCAASQVGHPLPSKQIIPSPVLAYHKAKKHEIKKKPGTPRNPRRHGIISREQGKIKRAVKFHDKCRRPASALPFPASSTLASSFFLVPGQSHPFPTESQHQRRFDCDIFGLQSHDSQ